MAKREPTTDRATKAAHEKAPTLNTTASTGAPAADPDFYKKLQEKWKKDQAEADKGELDATISDVILTKAGLVYGDKAKDPERPVIHVEITASDGKKFHETFSQPEGAASWRNSKFKLTQFLAKYGTMPDKGVKVKAGFDNDGFYKLVM